MHRAPGRSHVPLFLMALTFALCVPAGQTAVATPRNNGVPGPERLKEGAAGIAWAAVDTPGHIARPSVFEERRYANRAAPAASHEECSRATSVATGWPVANGYVVTNNHVLSEDPHVVLITTSGQEIEAWAVLRDDVDDIAILEVSDSNTLLPPSLPLARSAARLGSSVFTLGFPRIDVMGRTPKLSEGVISGANGLFDNPASYQTTVPIQPGNSGGPLLNMRGEVVGVMKSMLGIMDETGDRFYVLPNTSYAVKISSVKQLLHLLPPKDSLFAELPIHFDTLETLADRIRNSVLIVTTK